MNDGARGLDVISAVRTWITAIVIAAATVACGGQDPVLGNGAVVAPVVPVSPGAPTVTAVAPVAAATAVPTNAHVFTSAFSRAMDPTTLTAASFTLACPVGSAIAGTVSYASTGSIATLTLPASTSLPASTVCTATISTAVKDTTGVALAAPFVWTFTTGAAPDVVPPTVSATVPLLGATGVALNAAVSVGFSEPIDPLTINASTVLLACPSGTAVAGTVSYAVSGNVATLTPAAALPATTTCTGTVTTGVKDVAGNALAAPYVWTFATGAAADTTPPTVAATTPATAATAVALNARITATFSEPMDPLTITTTTFVLNCPNGTAVPGTVGYAVSGSVATFTPTASLPAGMVCVATIATGAKDVAGNALAAPYTWTFTTGVAPDTTPPTVSSTAPLAGATAVALNARIVVGFSEPIDPLTVSTATFTLACPTATPVTGTVGYAASGNVATFTPSANLPGNTTCSATVTTGVKDIAGNALAVPYTWTFTTGAAPDTTPPTVSSTIPTPSATAVALNGRVSVSFSEAMDPLTISASTLTLACPSGTGVAGTVAYAVSGNVATFTPNATLPPNAVCTATVTTGARDAAGNALAAPYTWTFTTGAAPDTTPPTVSSTAPLAGATAVPLNARIVVGFSEPMDPLTVSTATFVLACPTGTPVTGTVGYAASGNVATFTPSANLPGNTTCSATVTTGAKDVAGNALAVPYTWTFTTGATPDTTPPTVSSTIPATGATAFAINGHIGVTFSEPMDPLTLSGATFVLACPSGVPVTGTVAYAVNGNVATFTPAANLPATAVCTATVTTGAKDVAGNALATPYTWTFSTGAAPDTTPPTVSSTIPNAGAAGVAINSRISVSFSEAMDPLTIGTATFSLACPTGTAVGGTVAYATSGSVATFTPTVNLPASTTCTATVTTGAKDVAGNPLAAAYVWTFTTGAAPDVTPPTVTSTIPATGATLVAFNSQVNVSFSEPMDPLTLTAATFVLSCPSSTPIAGSVAYSTGSNSATFTPAANLPAATTCTATITTGAKDVAGNALAAPYVWTFTTGAVPDTTPPTVSSTVPAAGATGIAFNAAVAVSFSEPMDPLSITTGTVLLACPSGAPVAGTVAYVASGNVATFTPAANLPPATLCTATVTTGAKDVAGNALAAPYVWTFTTGAAPDTTPPTVASTVPAAGATNVVLNSQATATFSEAMNPSTISATTFLVACPTGTSVAGTVAYAVNGNVATFTPSAALPASTTCTATITTGVTDVAGNHLAAPYVWTFTTGVAPDITPPTVLSTNPANLAAGVCMNKTISATFSEALDPLTVTTATFTLQTTVGGAPVSGTVAYNSTTFIATFQPAANLIGTPATNYTATIHGGPSGVKDVAGNALVADQVVTFTTNASTCVTAPPLGAAATFGGFGGNATLTNDGLNTVINGDIGVNAASTTVTGLHDSGANVYTITGSNNGTVNGLVYTLTAPPASVPGQAVAQARADAQTAFNALSPGNLPGGIDASNIAQCPTCGGAGGGADELAGRTLPPGIYLSATGTFDIGGASRTTANLVLDAGGDPNAVWVFQTAAGTGTLNVGLTGPATPATPIMVQLVNGAQSKNVFWFAPAGAAIGTGSTMTGTIIADATITVSTTGTAPLPVTTTINGRVLALTAGVTLANTVINRPAP